MRGLVATVKPTYKPPHAASSYRPCKIDRPGNTHAKPSLLLWKDKRVNADAFAALESVNLTLAGPINLVQGGVAVIAPQPVYLWDNPMQNVSLDKPSAAATELAMTLLLSLLLAVATRCFLQRQGAQAPHRPPTDE